MPWPVWWVWGLGGQCAPSSRWQLCSTSCRKPSGIALSSDPPFPLNITSFSQLQSGKGTLNFTQV